MAELQRTLGFWMTSSFVFLNLVNTGIFFGVQLGAVAAGIDSLIAWGVLAVMSIYSAMCFSELTTMFPRAGGVYEFAKQAYGRFVSFEIGWIIWLINNIATALLVVAAVTYLLPVESVLLFGITISSGLAKTTLAIFIILLLNGIAYRGADDSARLMVGLSLFTLVLSVIVIVPGMMHVQMAHFYGFQLQWPLILFAAFLLSETFFGWESVSFMAEEIKDPERTIPRALNRTTIFVSIVSLAVAAVTFSVLGTERLAQGEIARPLLEVLKTSGVSSWLILLANVGIIVTFLGNAAGSLIGNPRLLMALSRDKLFIDQFADIHPRYQTPYRGILLQTVAVILIVFLASGAYERLLELVVLPSILLYIAMFFLIPYFRYTLPNMVRPYKAPLGKLLPFVMIILYGSFVAVWILYDVRALVQVRLLASFLLFSVPIYLLLTYFYNPDVLITTVNRFAALNLWFENLFLPRSVRRAVLDVLPNARGARVLELGAGVGTLTLPLADHVGSNGKLIAIDFSENNVRILRERLIKARHQHVEVVYDPHLVNRIHPSVDHVDIVVSVGDLSYFQDIEKILQEVYRRLPRRGRICFVEYVDMFWFLPNQPKWLSDPDKVRDIFSRAGFSIKVEVKRGLFWKYLYVYGMKEKSGVPYV